MTCLKTILVNEGSGFSVMYRVTSEGVAVLQADVASIDYAVINDDTKEVLTALTSLVVADVIYDTLQTDVMWTVDATGYNFRHDVPSTLLTDPLIKYRLEYRVTMNSSSIYFLSPVTVILEEMYSN